MSLWKRLTHTIFSVLYTAQWLPLNCFLCPPSSISSEGVCSGPVLFIICVPQSKKACLARVSANTAQMSNYSSGTREMPEECGRFTELWNVMLLVFSGGVDLEWVFFWEHITSCFLLRMRNDVQIITIQKSCFYKIRQDSSLFIMKNFRVSTSTVLNDPFIHPFFFLLLCLILLWLECEQLVR